MIYEFRKAGGEAGIKSKGYTIDPVTGMSKSNHIGDRWKRFWTESLNISSKVIGFLIEIVVSQFSFNIGVIIIIIAIIGHWRELDCQKWRQ